MLNVSNNTDSKILSFTSIQYTTSRSNLFRHILSCQLQTPTDLSVMNDISFLY